MRIDVKDGQGRPRLTLHVDPTRPSTVVKADDGRGPTVTMDWEKAIDDEGHLRHCPVCGCKDLYVRKQVPQLTVFVLILAAAVVAMVLFGSGLNMQAIIVLGVVLAIDLGVYWFAPRMLVCYRCRSEFREVPIGQGPRRWDSMLDLKYQADREAMALRHLEKDADVSNSAETAEPKP